MKILFSICCLSIAVNALAIEFKPSIIGSETKAKNLFNKMNSDFKPNAETSDRAHVWASEVFKKTGLKSQKVFIFFTMNYINRTGFKWWFQVAPAFVVNVNGKKELKVFDYTHASEPLSVKQWTDLFISSKRPCRLTEKYSEYEDTRFSEECFVIVDSMYYQLPGELSAKETSGRVVTEFNHKNIEISKQRAFPTKSSDKYKVILRPVNPDLSGYIPSGKMNINLENGQVSFKTWVDNLTSSTLEQKIHFGNTCPTLKADLNSDGVIDINEAAKVSGPAFYALETRTHSASGSATFFSDETVQKDNLIAAFENSVEDGLEGELSFDKDANLKGTTVILYGTARSRAGMSTEIVPLACGTIERQ